MNRLAVVLVVAIGLGAVAGVYWFRANRLTAADIAEIAEAQKRVEAIDSDTAAQSDELDTPSTESTPTEAPPVRPAAESNEQQAAPAEPAAAAKDADLPPVITVIPNESMPANTPEKFTVLFKTTKGPFAVEVTREWAPNGADRLYELVMKKFFTDMRVFRVVDGFVVQFGIPGDPNESVKWMDSNIPDDPVKQKNAEGTFTFAAGGMPNTRSTQVFINLGDNSGQLDHRGFAPVGKVVYGMDAVKSFNSKYGDAITNLQDRIMGMGNVFLDQQFPGLDTIKQAVFVETIEDAAAVEARKRAERQAADDPAKTLASETAPDAFKVRFDCSMGTIVVECNRAWAPNGADRFYTLVKNGFYNDAKFFRVVPNFIAQFGLPADPKLHGSWLVSRIPDDPKNISNTEGTVVFAKPANVTNARSTQIFINLKDNSAELDGQSFTPFGRVVEGMDVVKKINSSYGETPEQRRVRREGNEYLNANFPDLDGIKTAVIVEESPKEEPPAADTSPSPSETAPASSDAAPTAAETAPPPAEAAQQPAQETQPATSQEIAQPPADAAPAP
ncbi:MAG: peptidylprolyl isomerase [Candidatus Hydrogenedentes bacterium]|nr:peptidylprolyl isomerase [Candidatus Hydrogenedentota bacterium]